MKLNSEVQVDLAWWETFLPLWNTRSMMEVHNPNCSPSVEFSSDASGSWGYGAVWNCEWLQQAWDSEWEHQNIAAKELVPIAAACAILGPCWQSQQVLVQCDNMAVVHVITARSSRDKTSMHLLRCMHFYCAMHDFQLRVEQVPGHQNVIANSVSRNNLQVLFREAPSAHRKPTPISPAVWEFLTNQRQDWQWPTWRDWLKSSFQTAWQ